MDVCEWGDGGGEVSGAVLLSSVACAPRTGESPVSTWSVVPLAESRFLLYASRIVGNDKGVRGVT